MDTIVESVTVVDVTTDQEWIEYEVSLSENPQFTTRAQADRAAFMLDKELKRLAEVDK